MVPALRSVNRVGRRGAPITEERSSRNNLCRVVEAIALEDEVDILEMSGPAIFFS